ncbi:hypothetical protein Ahia01_001383500, partial [Argonauta hians]
EEEEEEEQRQPLPSRRSTSTRTKVKRNEKGETPLHRACIEGNLKRVELLIKQGQPVNVRDFCGWLPLHEAANLGYYQIVEVLLQHGADIDDPGGRECGHVTPLIDAAINGNLEVMQVLIDHGANILVKDAKGRTALMCLLSWRQGCGGDVGPETEQHYRAMVQFLQQKMGITDVGALRQSVARWDSDSNNSDHDDDDSETPPPLVSERRGGGGRRRQRDTLSQFIEEEEEEEEEEEGEASTGEESRPRHHRSLRRRHRHHSGRGGGGGGGGGFDDDDDEEEESATDAYRNVMTTIGSSAKQRLHRMRGGGGGGSNKMCKKSAPPPPPLLPPPPPSSSSSLTPSSSSSLTSSAVAALSSPTPAPLVSSERYVDSDWLIDDVQPAKRKRRVGPSGNCFTSGTATRNRNNSSNNNNNNTATCKLSNTATTAAAAATATTFTSATTRSRRSKKSSSRKSVIVEDDDDDDDDGDGDGDGDCGDDDDDDDDGYNGVGGGGGGYSNSNNNNNNIINVATDNDEYGVVSPTNPTPTTYNNNNNNTCSGSSSSSSSSSSCSRSNSGVSGSNLHNFLNPNYYNNNNRFGPSSCSVAMMEHQHDYSPEALALAQMLDEDPDFHVPDATSNMASLVHNFYSSASTLSGGSSLPPLVPPGLDSVTPATHYDAGPQTSSKVFVKVGTLCFCVPLSPSDRSKPILWLNQEVSRRVYGKCQLKPRLSLTTKSGALLDLDDKISMVIANGEELEGCVSSWDLPPVQDRYTEACNTTNTAGVVKIRILLEESERSGHLGLSNMALTVTMVRPVFRSVKFLSNLSFMNLSGNRLGDAGFECLASVLPTLPSLTTLDLSCTGITLRALKELCRILECSEPGSSQLQHQQDSIPLGLDRKPLQKLESLNLSYNHLTDECSDPLMLTLSHLPALTHLAIASCHLTHTIFQQAYRTPPSLTSAPSSMRACYLKHVNVSHNRLDSCSVQLLFKWLDPTWLVSLDMSWTSGATATSCLTSQLVSSALMNFLPLCENPRLTQLSVAGCDLTAEDGSLLARLPLSAPRLQMLDLSGNPNLGQSVLTELLHNACANADCALECIDMYDCGLEGPISSQLLDCLASKLTMETPGGASNPLVDLRFTCANLGPVDRNSLKQVWGGYWQSLALCQFPGADRVRLSVGRKGAF